MKNMYIMNALKNMKNMTVIKCIILAFFTIFTSFCYGQYKELRFKHYGVEDGLPSSIVQGIAQDKNGIIWLASKTVCFFDGYSFKSIPSPVNPITGEIVLNINNIHIDADHKLWIGTQKGLYLFDIDKMRYCNYNSKDVDNLLYRLDVQIIKESNDGTLWVGSGNLGLIEIKKQSGHFITNQYPSFYGNKNNPKTSKVTSICFDNQQNVWVGGGVTKLNPSTKQISTFYKDTIANSCSAYDGKDNIYTGGLNGFFRYNIKTNQYKQFTSFYTSKPNKEGFYKESITSISIDNKGYVWFSIDFSGLFIFDPKKETFQNYQFDPANKYSISGNDYRNIFFDKHGLVWISVLQSGLDVCDLNQKAFESYAHNPNDIKSLSDKNVTSIYEDSKQNLWVGTWEGGLNLYDANKNGFNHFKNNPDNSKSIPSNQIGALIEDNYGYLWVLSWWGCLSKLNINNKVSGYQNSFISYKSDWSNPKGLFGYGFRNMVLDQNKSLWISENNLGIYKVEKETNGNERFIRHEKIISDKDTIKLSAWQMICDKYGNLWLATDRHGVIKYNPTTNQFKRYTIDKKNPNKSLRTSSSQFLYEASDGIIWIATGEGLHKLNPQTDSIKVYDKTDGLPDNVIRCFLEDAHQNLWISTDFGISKFNPKTETFLNFDKEDGLVGKEFNLNAAFKSTHSGFMYFGSNEGLNYFHPDSIKINPFVPNVIFTELRIMNKKINPFDTLNNHIILTNSIFNTKTIELTHDENDFYIEFSTNHYSCPKKNKFAYKLEGYSKDWIYTDASRRFVSYTGLPAGEYILKVIGSNNDGVWCDKPAEIIIRILPPWWQTLWFRILVILVILILAISYYKYKTHEIKKKNLELERKVSERTNEVMQQKEELQQQAEELEATNEELTAQSDALRMSNEELNLKNYEIEKSFKISQVISEFGQRVTSTFDLESINEIVYGYICSIMPTDAFGIGLYKEEKNEIEYIGFIESGNKIENFTKNLSAENSLSAWCFNNQKPVFINDLTLDYINYIQEIPKVSTNKQPLSIIHLPLSTNDRKLGIIVVNNNNKNSYTSKDLINLQSLASYITIALDNADAYKTVNAQKEKLLELDKFKEGMTGMIVHDLKNPLNAVIGISSMFQDDDMWLMVNSAGNQMLNLVLNILDVQKFENTDVKLNLSENTVSSLAKEACKQVSLLIKQKNQKLSVFIEPKTVVKTDQEIMVRVFVNMLTNAIKYTPNGGDISIKIETIFNHIEELKSNSLVGQKIKEEYNTEFPLCLISVNDTGLCIPKEKQYLVFEKFGQVEAKKSGGVRSTGLGMTFCKMVIEAHGGHIWLTSEVGEGTSFYFSLPCLPLDQTVVIEENDEHEENFIQIERSEASKSYTCFSCTHAGAIELNSVENDPELLFKDSNFIKIMAVDDDLYSLKVYREFLCDSKLNFYFIQVIDLINTVEIAVYLEPDIILMDWEMPGVSGTDLIVNLKANQVTKSIPVIMVTSRSSNSDIQTAFDVGAIDYIRKPIEKTEIIARVNTIAEFVKVLKPLRVQNKKSTLNIENKNSKNQISILYVEDSVELRSYVSACLKEQYIVIEAENGKIGL